MNSMSWQASTRVAAATCCEGLGNRRRDVLEVNACQLSRERDGELRDLLELASGRVRDDDMLRTDIEPPLRVF